jgi:hypothetical protein
MVMMETSEIQKLVFPINNPEGKVSVRYYLNTNLKPKISDTGENLYPLYFNIVVKRQNTTGKSLIETNLMTEKEFKLIEKHINFNTKEEFSRGFRNLFSDSSSMELLIPILTEKFLIFDIIVQLNPFSKADFDIKSIMELFEHFNTTMNVAINKRLKLLLKQLLKDEPKADNLIAKLYLRSLDWENGNAFDLWLIIKDTAPVFNHLLKKFGRCFQVITGNDVLGLPEYEVSIINGLANKTLMKVKNEMEDVDFPDKPIYKSVVDEMSLLLF